MNLFCDAIHTQPDWFVCVGGLYIPTLTAKLYMTSGFRSDADENCAPLIYYAASSGNFLQTLRDSLYVPSLGVKKPKENCTVCYLSSCSQRASLSALYSGSLVECNVTYNVRGFSSACTGNWSESSYNMSRSFSPSPPPPPPKIWNSDS
jgi:hypothetical protein